MQCEIAIVVYDVTNKISLREANHCITIIKDNIKEHPVEFILVGNKVMFKYDLQLQSNFLSSLINMLPFFIFCVYIVNDNSI